MAWDPLNDPAPAPLIIRNLAKRLDYAKREVAAARYYDLFVETVERAARAQEGEWG